MIHGKLIGRARAPAGLLVFVVGLLASAPLGAEAVRALPPVDLSQCCVESTEIMHARYFSPDLGRFLSVDPVGGEVGSSQSWNRYSYVRNNPIIRNDPTGLIDGGLVKHEHNTAMGIYPPAVPQKEAAWLAGLGASLTLAAVTSGQSLTLNLLSGALSNMTGGVVTRGLDGDDTTAALDTRSMLVDGGAGALSTGAAEKLMGVKAVTTAVDNVVGVGAARVAGWQSSVERPRARDHRRDRRHT